ACGTDSLLAAVKNAEILLRVKEAHAAPEPLSNGQITPSPTDNASPTWPEPQLGREFSPKHICGVDHRDLLSFGRLRRRKLRVVWNLRSHQAVSASAFG